MISILSLISSLAIASQKSDCITSLDEKYRKYTALAERIFVAYTENKIKNYEIKDPLICNDRIIVAIDGTGPNRGFGASWLIRYDRKDHSVEISPGM